MTGFFFCLIQYFKIYKNKLIYNFTIKYFEKNNQFLND